MQNFKLGTFALPLASIIACLFFSPITVSADEEIIPKKDLKEDQVGAPAVAAENVEFIALLAEHVTDTTMIAISPLVVVSAQSAWMYIDAEDGQEDKLPWHCSPWVWGTLCVIGLIFMANTTLGNVFPFLKTPMNVVEENESKVTALLVGMPVVVTKVIPDLTVSELESTISKAESAEPLMAGIVPSALGAFAAIPILLAIYGVVWLAFHTVHVIALISPFGQVDAFLKISRLALLGIIAGATALSPVLGLVLCSVLIVICYFISGWSFRFTVFGTVFSWDLLTFAHRRAKIEEKPILGFTSSAIGKTPVRSFGKVQRSELGKLEFHYKPWLFLPKRTIELPDKDPAIQKGILSPSLLAMSEDADTRDHFESVLRFPPRYRWHEEAIKEKIEACSVREHIFKRGFSSAYGWCKEMVNTGRKKLLPEPQAT